MSEEQNYRCAICDKIPQSYGYHTKLVLDHCHEKNKIRSLLCDKCNKGLGHFQDNIEILKSAIKYLRKHNKEI